MTKSAAARRAPATAGRKAAAKRLRSDSGAIVAGGDEQSPPSVRGAAPPATAELSTTGSAYSSSNNDDVVLASFSGGSVQASPHAPRQERPANRTPHPVVANLFVDGEDDEWGPRSSLRGAGCGSSYSTVSEKCLPHGGAEVEDDEVSLASDDEALTPLYCPTGELLHWAR